MHFLRFTHFGRVVDKGPRSSAVREYEPDKQLAFLQNGISLFIFFSPLSSTLGRSPPASGSFVLRALSLPSSPSQTSFLSSQHSVLSLPCWSPCCPLVNRNCILPESSPVGPLSQGPDRLRLLTLILFCRSHCVSHKFHESALT